MRKTNTGKRVLRLLVVLLIVGFLAGQASAYTAPYRLMVFTDKQVYLDFGYNFDTAPFTYTQQDNTKGSFNQRPNVFAVLLDSDGNIVRGLSGSNFSATIRDLERWNHSGPALDSYPFYQVITTNGAYYNSLAFPAFTDADGDGIFNSSYDVTDLNQLGSPPAVTDQVNISINVTVSYQGTNYKTNVSVIFGTAGCHHPTNSITSAHSKSSHDNVVCTACHWGYQYALGVHGFNNSIMFNDPARYTVADTKVTAGYDYKLGYVITGGNATTWDNSNASFCVMCHGGPINRNILDLGVGSAPTSTDQNGDGIPDNNRPSCSWYQGPLGNNSAYPVCHGPAQGFDGSTKITWSSLNGTDWKGWSQGPGTSKSHNHSTSPKTNGTPCELCHAGGGAPGTGTGGLHNVAGLPNRSTDYTNINEQCWNCHNTTDGWLNITSNGGTAKNHSKTNQCSNCHVDNNKLSSHTVPVGAYGGRWCMDCHNLTGKAPIDMKVDPSITNVSNQNYIHYNLNGNSDASNSSRICWGCHANNSYVINGRVNSTSLPLSEHPGGYDSPRSCTYCHNNSNVTLNFGAPQTYRHTWYAPNMKTPAVTYCVNCHAQDEDLNLWSEDIYPPKTDNESTAHYGKNRTALFEPLIGTREYCGYCHQNESTVMGPFANRDNEVRSDHASQPTTPGCGDVICHRPGRMHEDTLVIPSFTEANISATCLACHSSSNYSYHNSTLSCWDCHMGNVSNTTATWIHPIQFIQYNGNFTGAKLTGATCYDCHKSTRVDSTIKNLSGKNVPKIYNQGHSNDLMNGTKWGDYWKYTPTTYEFASYDIIGNGTIDPAYPFENIKVPSNDYMQLKETQTGSPQGGLLPYTKAERQINGPPVPNWTSSTKVIAGTTTLAASQDAYNGNPAGSLKATLKTRSSSGSGSVSWNYSFYYNPNSTQFAYTNASADYNITVSSALTQTVYLRLVKPSGIIVTLASASSSSSTSWLTLTNNSFASAFDEDGSVVPYKIQLYTVLNGTGSRTVQNPYTIYYDNVLVKFQEKVWNRYDIIINTTGVPVNGSSKLGMSYQVHNENTSLMIFNRTSRTYELLDTLDKGVFFDYVKDINSTYHIDPIGDGTTGNVSVRFVDTDMSETDAISDKLHIRYLYVFTDRGLQYPCEQCHSPNKHYINPTLGSPEKFNAGNRVNQTISSSSTWCQQCHWQGSANYSKMVQEYSVTRNPPENIPPEITGNKTYGNFTKSRDGKTSYVNHTGSAYSDMSDLGCFRCHGKSGDITTSQFIHNVQAGQSGNRQCITCHNSNSTNYKKIDVDAVRQGMHGGLKNASANVSNTSDPIELACWACHGDGIYNNPDQHRNANAWTCDKCHTNATSGKLSYGAPQVYEHIPPGSVTPDADIKTTFNHTTWVCANCHNNSINTTALINDNENDPINATTGHYGLNRTRGMLMYNYTVPPKGNSEDCTYCHRGNSSNMTRWGINVSSTKNLSNKVSPTDHRSFTNDRCGSCHNYSANAGFTFHTAEINAGGGSGPDCTGCHDVNGSGAPDNTRINASAIKQGAHKNLNRNATNSSATDQINKACWACHGEGTEPSSHPANYAVPWTCLDCHNSTASFTSSNTTIKNDVTRKKTPEHIQFTYQNISSTRNASSANCTFCHSLSMTGFTDTASINVTANVSHYADTSALVSPTTNCILCHKNLVNASKYKANVTRHPAQTQNVAYCRYCHNTTNASSLHSQSLDFRFGSTSSIHGGSSGINFPGFDWEEDDWNEKIGLSAREDEGCNACHYDSANFQSFAQICENCHLPDGNSLFTGPRNRNSGLMRYNASINDSIPRVYSHTNYSSMNVANQSQGGASSCYGFGNMTCHGIDYYNRSSAGGYFAYNYMYTDKAIESDASHFTNTIDRLPDTRDCLFCHNQSNTTIKKAWGNAPNPGQTRPGIHTANNMNDTKCYDCHTTDKSAPKDFHANTLIPSLRGNPNCVSCHNVGGNFSNVDFTAINLSIHGGLNRQALSSPETATNKPCWGCHGTRNGTYANESDQPVNDHNLTVYKAPRKCPDCHVTGSLQFTTKNVTDHIPAGYTNNTDVDTSVYNYTYCSYCHNNSVNNNLEPDGMGLSGSGSPTNASVSHYGANRTSGRLMSTTSNSTDCVYCHRNSSNMLKWGILQGSLANISNKNATGGGSNHNDYTASSSCSQCHGNYAVVIGFTFHNGALGNGSGGAGGPNCKTCHDVGAGGSAPKVNFSVMNDTSAIHKDLNSKASASDISYNESKKCWACHGDGNEPGAHSSNYKNPYNCTDCHSKSGSQSGKYPGWNVTEHVNADTVNNTEIFTPGAGNCYACHNRSEMMISASDPDSGTGAIYGGSNGGNNSTSHYGKKRNLGSGDTYCNYCHSNVSSIFYLSNQNMTIFEHTANNSADIKNSSLGCNNALCHSTGRIHNDTMIKPSVQAWTSGKQDYCAPCHRAGDPGATRYVYGHNSSNMTAINTDCGYCHNATSQGQTGGMIRIHTSTLTNRSPTNTTCVLCHQDATYVTSQRVIYTHYPGASSGKANTSLDNFACETCHGGMPANKMHAPVSTPTDRCNNCHNGTSPGIYKATRVPYINTTRHDNASHNVSNVINCEWCHNNTNAVQRFHFTQWPNGTVQSPGWQGWANGTNTNCTNCHDTYNQTKPFYAEPIWHKGIYGATPDNCYQCHTSITSAASGSVPVAMHNVTKAIDWGYCNNCHSNNYGGAPIVDNASLANSMHYNLNGSTPSSTEPACKACHGGNSTMHRNAVANNCTYCHINGSTKYSAKGVSRHIPYPYTSDVNTSRYSQVFCSDCHNNSLRAFSDPTPYSRNATVAHYGMNSTGGKLMYNASGNSEDCIYCHRNNSNMAAWGVLNTSNANLSKKGGTHATAPNSDCYICHVSSASVPANLHVQDLNAGVGGGPDCKACHDIGGSATGRLVNFSAINGSLAIHKNLNKNASDPTGNPENRICWACHTTNGTAPQAGNHSFVDRYKNPYNCTDCHISKAGQNLNFTPRAILNVTQHKADTVNGTTIFTPGAADCYSCHNISEMMIRANDPDNGTGAVYGGSHGGDASVSHYGLKRDLGSDDAYCNYCHSNDSSMFPFVSQHNKTIFEHTGNSTADIRNGTSLNCTDCHTTNQQSYRIHNSTLRTPAASAWTAGREDRCAPCHRTTGSGSSLKVNNTYHNTTGNITDCGYCHNSDAMKVGAPQNIHSDNLTRGGNSTYDNCYNCHQNGFASKVIIEHTNSTGANITNASMTCEKSGCHNSSRTHSKALIKPATTNWTAGGNDYCAPCHNSSDSINNATKKIYNKGHDPENRTDDNITSCGNCHNASTPGGIPGSFRLHDPSLTNLSGSDDSTCEGCHNGTTVYVGTAKQLLSHLPNASQYRGNTSMSNYTCKSCHNMTNKPSMHSAGMNRSSGTCETCHFNNTSPFRSLTKNISHMAGMLNHSYNGSSNTTCKMCHNASGRVKFHLSKYASGDIADPQDSNGNPTFADRATWDLGLTPPETNDRGILVDCRDCHEKYNDTAPFFAPFQEANRTGVNNQNHVGKNYTLKNCYVCHTAEDNVSRPFTLHNVSIEPLTGGPNCTKCHDIASQNRTLSHMLWVNYTAFNSTGSIHRNFTNATAWGGSALFTLLDTACWVCHESDGMQPERHTDLLDDPTLAGGSRAYKCEACHTEGGIVSSKQPSIYQKATKVSKHYPSSVFLNEIIFTGNVSCGMCHKNGMVSNINISGYTNNIDANTTNASHYGIRAKLTNTSLNLNGCQKCHGVGGEGQDTLSYGNARTMPLGHNDMGSTPQACQKSCHNSAVGDNGLSVPIKLHNNSVGINIGGNACFSPECHPSPPVGDGGGGRR